MRRMARTAQPGAAQPVYPRNMSRFFLALFLAVAVPGWSLPVTEGVERRYNSLRSLTAKFDESVSYNGRVRRQESGTLYLLRPRRMRWEYTQPAGKLFVSDGKMFYLYSPNSNQVQKIKPKEAEDLRAPLAFLLGKLNFGKEFGPTAARTTGEGIELTAAARSPQEAYTQAVFLIDPDSFRIRRISVHGQDGQVTEFVFSGETLNPSLETRLFQFQPPPGAEIVETGR